MRKKELRTEIARKLREYLSDICKLINLSRDLTKKENKAKARFKIGLKDKIKLPDGGVSIQFFLFKFFFKSIFLTKNFFLTNF